MHLRKPHFADAVAVASVLITLRPSAAPAQTFAPDDPVVRHLWKEGVERSQTERLAQVLLDSIGPRLAGTPGFQAAVDWLVETYGSWGIPVRREQYGTWYGWQPGTLHVDLISPRVQTLGAKLLARSPGTVGPLEGEVVMPPRGLSGESAAAWLRSVAGKAVLTTPPEPMCRARQELERFAREETVRRIDSLRADALREWEARLEPLGESWIERERAIDAGGALAVVTSRWSGGWGANRIFDTVSEKAVGIDLSCEDYGLLFRLAANGQGPRIRIEAEAHELGEVPQFNVIAELRGTEIPDEYVLLSAHLDSWHGASGATDNGTGTITMLEAMRLLSTAYPRPRRTILVGHWGGEEVGLVGSRAFVEDHPEVVEGLQAAFNQDNGTWRVERIEGQGFASVGPQISRWMASVPPKISAGVELEFPGAQANGGSDHSAFVCMGAPAFRLQSSYDEYRQYTWHTNLDTYDKIVFDDLKRNATLAALLAYAASEDDDRLPRDRAELPSDPRTGEPRPWMTCEPASRSRNR